MRKLDWIESDKLKHKNTGSNSQISIWLSWTEMGILETIKLLNNAIEYIERNLDATLDIDELSKAAYSSRYHFQRVFHALTGKI